MHQMSSPSPAWRGALLGAVVTSSPEKTPVIVTVADARLSDISKVAEELREAGVDVQEVLEFTGQVTGTIRDPAQKAAIMSIDGVEDVAEAGEVSIPPPDSDIQ